MQTPRPSRPRSGPILIPLVVFAGLAVRPGGLFADDAALALANQSIARAEAKIAAGEPFAASEAYRTALRLAAPLPPEALAPWRGEAVLVFVRLAGLRGVTGESVEDASALESWSKRDDLPLTAAWARRQLGYLDLAQGASVDAARERWRPLGYLERWRVIGPFDNERGGGFETAYPPETEPVDFTAAYNGKTQRVSWRELPSTPLAGLVDLGSLFEPNEECLAYALTYLESASAQTVAIRLGTKDSYKLWVNGELVQSKNLHRPFRRGQDSAGVRLRKGWNQILVKLAQSKGPWRFSARVTAPDGSPLADVEEGDAPAEERAKIPEGPAEGSSNESPKIRPNVLEELAAATTPETTDAREAYRLGALFLQLHPHDENEHPDEEWIERAVALDADPSLYYLSLASSRRRNVSIAARQEENAWRRTMLTALDRGSARAAYELGRYYYRQFRNLTVSRTYCDRALELNPSCEAALRLRADIATAAGFPLAAERLERDLAALPNASVLTRSERIDKTLRAGKLAEAERLLRERLATNALDGRLRSRLATLLAGTARDEEALSLLEEGHTLDPYSDAWLGEIARFHEGRDHLDGALAAIARAVAICPDDPDLVERRARLELRSGERASALASFDRVLELKPNSPQIRDYVEYLRASGDSFEDEHRRDVASVIAAALAAERDDEESPARILFELTATEVNVDGTAREFHQTVVEVLNDYGVRQYDTFGTYYADGDHELEFVKGRVHHRDGRVTDAKLERYGGERGGSGTYRRGGIDLPPLSPGDVVEVEYIRQDTRQSFFGDYFGHRELFQQSVPIREKVFVLEVPRARRFNFHRRNFDVEPRVEDRPESDSIVYEWVAKNVPKLEAEPGMPPLTEISPLLEVSTFANWTEFTSWYWNLIRKQFESSPEIRRKVRELTSGAENDLERIRAIYNFIVTDIRYNMWEFGVHGFKPYNAANIFARKFGDCKDKATLMSVMLKEVGIDAYPVLIYGTQSRANEDLSLPLVNHFNHCITYIPGSDEHPELFLDGTAQRHALEELPSMDRGADVLVVNPDGGELKEIPWNDPNRLQLIEETRVRVDEDLGAELDLRVECTGDYAVYVRRSFEIESKRKETLERWFSRKFAGSTIEAQEFSALGDLDQPVSLRASIRVPKFVVEAPEGLTLRPESDFFSSSAQLAALGGLEERRFDVLVGNPRRSSLETVYELPAGLRVKSLPEPLEKETAHGLIRVEYTADSPQRVVVRRTIEVRAARVDVAEYDVFREFTSAIGELDRKRILLERT